MVGGVKWTLIWPPRVRLDFKLIFNIRSTWGRPLIPNVKTRLAFLLGENIKDGKETLEKNISGSTEASELQEEIERENSEHHDIIQGDFVDSYRNLSYKNIMGKLWVSEFCKQVSILTIRKITLLVDGNFIIRQNWWWRQMMTSLLTFMG